MCYIQTQITTVILLVLLSLIPQSVLSFTPSSNHNRQQTKLKMSTEIATPQKIDGISSPLLMDNYDTFLLDMWGGKS